MPDGVDKESILGSKARSVEKIFAMTTSGEARKICVAGFESSRPEKFLLYDVMIAFLVPCQIKVNYAVPMGKRSCE